MSEELRKKVETLIAKSHRELRKLHNELAETIFKELEGGKKQDGVS